MSKHIYLKRVLMTRNIHGDIIFIGYDSRGDMFHYAEWSNPDHNVVLANMFKGVEATRPHLRMYRDHWRYVPLAKRVEYGQGVPAQVMIIDRD